MTVRMHRENTLGRAFPSPAVGPVQPGFDAAFGEPRNFLNNRFIYLVISQRAHGLSIGVNMNPNQVCNFNCIYCEVKRNSALSEQVVNVPVMSAELKHTLDELQEGRIFKLPCYRTVPEELLQLREVALSGDGEPTLCPNFTEVVQALVHIRALAPIPFFKLVLITNATGLHLPEVQRGLKWFTGKDEIWAKLDAGSQEYMRTVNRTDFPLEKVMANLLHLGQQRPIIIQSLFSQLQGKEPSIEEIDQYVQRLKELKERGAAISLVQIYSAHRPTALPDCRHLSLRSLSRIAQRVREATGLEAEVF